MLQYAHNQPCPPATQRVFQPARRMMVASRVPAANTATSVVYLHDNNVDYERNGVSINAEVSSKFNY
jgi:hypothetical protein